MAEYIKRDELAKWLKDESDSYSTKDVAPVGWILIGLINELSKIPTADVVEHKHGKWIRNEFGSMCGACGLYAYRDKFGKPWESPYCPNCGADMRGEDDEKEM